MSFLKVKLLKIKISEFTHPINTAADKSLKIALEEQLIHSISLIIVISLIITIVISQGTKVHRGKKSHPIFITFSWSFVPVVPYVQHFQITESLLI